MRAIGKAIRRGVRLLVVLAVYGVVILVGVEMLLRLTDTGVLHSVLVLEQNENRYLPGQRATFTHVEWDYEIAINADGFRNDKPLDALTPGAVAALGDSFTEGYGVALEDSYPKVLERRFASLGRHDVYNAGHTDSGIAYYRRVFEKFIDPVEAIDYVVIGFFAGNDFISRDSPLTGRLPVKRKDYSPSQVLNRFLNEHSLLYTNVNRIVKTNATLRRLCQSLGRCRGGDPANIYSADVETALVRPTAEYLIAFGEQVRASGREPVFLLIPSREQIVDPLWEMLKEQQPETSDDRRVLANRLLADALRQAGLPTVDLTEASRLAHAAEGKQLYFQYDAHWTAAGHELAGDLLFARFQQLLDDRR